MKNIFDQFDKEDFYMIEFKIKEYGRSFGSFVVLNTLWPWVQLFLNIFIIVILNGVFTAKQPILYLVFLLVSFLNAFQCLFLCFRKKQRKNVLKQAAYYSKSIILIGFTMVMMGFSVMMYENKEIMLLFFKSNKLESVVNILLGISIITVFLSFFLMFWKLKSSFYKKNSLKKKKIQLYNALSVAAIPGVTVIIFLVNLLTTTNLSIIDIFMTILFIIIGYVVTSCSADFYMVYYLRKRFPEDFVKEDQMEEE